MHPISEARTVPRREAPRFDTTEMLIGLCVGGLVAFAAFISLSAATSLLEMAVLGSGDLGDLVFILVAYTLLGPLIAEVLCVCIGLPVWRVAQERNLSSPRAAAFVGAAAGAAFAIAWRIIWVWDEWSRRNVGGSASDFSWGLATQLNHLPTAFGWLIFVAEMLKLALVGAITGLTARSITSWCASRRTRAAAPGSISESARD